MSADMKKGAYLELRTRLGTTLTVNGLNEQDERDAGALIAKILKRDGKVGAA